MGQAAAVVLADGQVTPVNVTFSPEQVTPSLSVFSDRAGGMSQAFRRLRVSTVFAGGKSVVNKSRFSVEIPVAQTVSGVTTVPFTLRANVELILPDLSTDSQRKDLYAFVRNGLANTLLTGAIRDLDPLY